MSMEQMKPLEYTIKIYGEGFTEWFYFDGLRTNNRFRFTMEPEVPKNSRSSYKQILKLIDKELKKNPQERADAIFMVIDTDTLMADKKQYAVYLAAKEKYKAQGVIFIESHPCIELWFMYHLAEKFARTNYETYEALRPTIEALLPGYEKTARYYQRNRAFRDNILQDINKRAKAIEFGIRACKYDPIEGEVANYSELFKAIHFFRLMQKYAEIRALISERLRCVPNMMHLIDDHKSLKIIMDKDTLCCVLRYADSSLRCIFMDGKAFDVDDKMPLPINHPLLDCLVQILA